MAVLTNPNSPPDSEQLRRTESAARSLGFNLTEYAISAPDQLADVFRSMIAASEGAALFRGTLWFLDAKEVAELALKHRLPTMHKLT